MELWLLEFIKEITKGHWNKNGGVLQAEVGNISVTYDPQPAAGLQPHVSIYQSGHSSVGFVKSLRVDPKDWTFAQRDVTRNRLKNIPKPEGRKPVLYVIMGPPASGKSSYIHDNLIDLPVVSPDLYDPEGNLEEGDRWWNLGGPGFHREYIGKAWSWTWQQFSERLQAGTDFTFEATLSLKIARSPIINLAKGFGFKVVCVYHCESLQTLLERNANRSPSVPVESLARLFLADEEPEFEEGWDEIILANATEHGDMHAAREET
jgi:predicted kinase